MLQNIFRNMQPVVKNLLIINALFFLATWVFQQKGIYLSETLGLFYFGSDNFQPFQLATHFFMHGGFWHILLNMFALVVFGNVLEQVWGAKRFLLFYFITALGAALLHELILGIEIYSATGTFFPNTEELNSMFTIRGDRIYFDRANQHLLEVYQILHRPTVGASGAVYGLLAAVALLFPNTTVYLYFAIPVKMKWLALIAGGGALLYGVMDTPGDSVAHFAHLGGMLFGFILVKLWQGGRSNFY